MKKNSLILTAFLSPLMLNGFSHDLAKNSAIPTKAPYLTNIFLPVPLEHQDTNYYCLIATLRSLMSYWGITNLPSQEQIYHELVVRGNPGENGIPRVSQDLLDYLSNFINSGTGKALQYVFNNVTANHSFGIFSEDLENFSNYVEGSLTANTPLVLVYFNLRQATGIVGHSVILCGIQRFSNLLNTKYTIMDPWTGSYRTFLAGELYSLTTVGFVSGAFFPWLTPLYDQMIFEIPNFHGHANNLSDNQVVDLGLQDFDLTHFLVMDDKNYLRKTLTWISFPDFYGQIRRPNQLPKIFNAGFYFNIKELLPPTLPDDLWTSPNFNIDHDLQQIGCETLNTNYSAIFGIGSYGPGKINLIINYAAHARSLSTSETGPTLKGEVTLDSGARIIFKRIFTDFSNPIDWC